MAKKRMFQILKETVMSVAASLKTEGGKNIGNVVNRTLNETKKKEFGDESDRDDGNSSSNNNSGR